MFFVKVIFDSTLIFLSYNYVMAERSSTPIKESILPSEEFPLNGITSHNDKLSLRENESIEMCNDISQRESA